VTGEDEVPARAAAPIGESFKVKRIGDNRLPALAAGIRTALATVLETEKRGERG